ncbi:hypothetical protein GF327_08580 [Candidatus Woesearchaeota archaeon]|nr:hypothetical protein [Candidatus Woesearchaeota archaeon]
MQAMYKNKIITLGLKIYTKDGNLPEILDELILNAKQFVEIKLVLLDRGFRYVKITNSMENRKAPTLKYLPA